MCQVEQQRSTVPTDNTGALNQQMGNTLSVTDESSEASGRDDLKHDSWLVVGVGFPPPDVLSIAGRGVLSRVSGQFPKWHSVAVGDVPGAPASVLAVVLLLTNLDGEQALLAGVECPSVAIGVTVARLPDLLCLGWGHRSVSLVDLLSLQGGEVLARVTGDSSPTGTINPTGGGSAVPVGGIPRSWRVRLWHLPGGERVPYQLPRGTPTGRRIARRWVERRGS